MDVEKMTKLQTPSSREIPNSKQQNPDFRRPSVCGLRFGAWNLFGTWCLGLGVLAAVALSLTGCVTDNSLTDTPSPPYIYPATRKTNVVDDYNGVKVAD